MIKISIHKLHTGTVNQIQKRSTPAIATVYVTLFHYLPDILLFLCLEVLPVLGLVEVLLLFFDDNCFHSMTVMHFCEKSGGSTYFIGKSAEVKSSKVGMVALGGLWCQILSLS
mmetsp:Transcript_1895/g.5535  ORF Transcript_1895/g.5535 Transcript_1895/m.5535 type:complete len:113 (+) Transcript_1895:24-362(+)